MAQGNKGRAKRFAWLSTALGMAVMGLTAVLMYAGAPWLFRILTPDATVRALGVQVLRIEAFAEPLFAASIVAAGALRGAGDTLVPSVLNLVSMWGVRITLAAVLAPRFGLPGVWFAMCFELCRARRAVPCAPAARPLAAKSPPVIAETGDFRPLSW